MLRSGAVWRSQRQPLHHAVEAEGSEGEAGVVVERPDVEIDGGGVAGGGFALEFGEERAGNATAAKGGSDRDRGQVTEPLRGRTPRFFPLAKLGAKKGNRLIVLCAFFAMASQD